jgi:hypothetical protein
VGDEPEHILGRFPRVTTLASSDRTPEMLLLHMRNAR